MRFVVRHETLYRYSAPIVLAPHVLRLTPRPGYRLLGRSLHVRPEPLELREEVDAYGNQVMRATFSSTPTTELGIESRFELDTSPPRAEAEDSSASLPWTQLPDASFEPYLSQEDLAPAVAGFARSLADQHGLRPVAFLEALCATICARADRHIRPTGDAQSALETLATWRGACRDYTVLFLAAARSLGIPGRFCSGYQAAAETPDGRRHLHAWPEVFVPGQGWRGWDPTHGLAVGEGHVALCAAPAQAATMPVSGGFFFTGESVTSTLDFSVNIATS